MSAKELIEQVKALPPVERGRFYEEVLALEMMDEEAIAPAPSLTQEAAPRSVNWPDFEARARAIFGDRVLPNMVLEDRAMHDF